MTRGREVFRTAFGGGLLNHESHHHAHGSQASVVAVWEGCVSSGMCARRTEARAHCVLCPPHPRPRAEEELPQELQLFTAFSAAWAISVELPKGSSTAAGPRIQTRHKKMKHWRTGRTWSYSAQDTLIAASSKQLSIYLDGKGQKCVNVGI